MRVLLVTSWGTSCGIAQHSAQLIDAVNTADPTIGITPSAEALDPFTHQRLPDDPHVLHLNFHRALHSCWTPAILQLWKDTHKGIPVIITWHDSYEYPPDQLTQDLCALADAFIVHEPQPDLPKALYWRMGVPEWDGTLQNRPSGWFKRPYLGTVGFNFAFKCWQKLAEIAATVGWGFVVCTPEMNPEEEQQLHRLNPWVDVRQGLETQQVLGVLRDCTATAFTNVTGNSGQSAAILMGIAAKKPLIALATCRQYRALLADPLSNQAIMWANTFEEVQQHLTYLTPQRFDTGICALAEQDSWKKLGAKYASLYRSLVV
jgi:hypothetical protein